MTSSDSESDRQDLLRRLQEHGQQFIQSFDLPSSSRKRKEASSSSSRLSKKQRTAKDEESDNSTSSETEWAGFGGAESDESSGDEVQRISHRVSKNHNTASENRTGKRSLAPSVVVFSDMNTSGQRSNSQISKAKMKAFMSSKVAKLKQDVEEGEDRKAEGPGDEEEDLNASQNDALLHRLIHTKLLSGPFASETDVSPAKRRKAFSGRIIEVAGQAKLGKGESAVRSSETNRAAKKVRDGLLAKQRERNAKALEEAKHMGNYHPTLKQLYDSDGPKRSKKRERGLNMGVGSFKGGFLKLRRKDLSSIERSESKPRRGKGKGGRP